MKAHSDSAWYRAYPQRMCPHDTVRHRTTLCGHVRTQEYPQSARKGPQVPDPCKTHGDCPEPRTPGKKYATVRTI